MQYQQIELVTSIYNPSFASAAGNKTTRILATATLTITSEGNSLLLRDHKSGREVEVPWSNIRYAFRAPTVVAPEVKAPKKVA